MKRIVFLLLVVACAPAFAQESDSLGSTPRLAVRWTPFALANRFQTINLGVEYRIDPFDPRWTLAHDLGIVLKSGPGTESYSNKNGFKAITEMRFYVEPKGRAPVYLAGEVYFHNINYDRTELIGYDCDGGCTYWEYSTWRRKYTMQRYSLKLGFVLFLSARKDTYFDFSGGIGYRVRRSRDKNKPPLPSNGTNFGTDEGWFESELNEDEQIWAPVFSFKFGYKFK